MIDIAFYDGAKHHRSGQGIRVYKGGVIIVERSRQRIPEEILRRTGKEGLPGNNYKDGKAFQKASPKVTP